MNKLSISTMWSQDRFECAEDFIHTVRRLGYPAVEINHVVGPAFVDGLLANDVTVSSVHSPSPRIQLIDGRWSNKLNLASLDEEERRLAVQLGKASLDLAAQAGARPVVFHLGNIDGGLFAEERQLRRLSSRGPRSGAKIQDLRTRCHQRRAEAVLLHFPQARRSLAELVDHAAKTGTVIGLEDRFYYHEIPSLSEIHILLDEFPAEVVGYWHDMGHAEVFHRLGLLQNRRWLDELADRCVGSHLHDVDGIEDHRAPGLGDADWDHIADRLPKEVPHVLEINQTMTEESLSLAIPFLKERGVL